MLSDKIKSLRATIGKDYVRPKVEKLEKYINELGESKKALDYLMNERGFNRETIDHFKLGYNKTKNAISIPVFKRGELINIKYRLLDPKKAKYLSERGAENWIYNEEGIEVALKKGAVLVVEGEFDLMAVWQKGIRNVVSPALGKDSYGVWLEKLDNIPQLYLAYDNDEGGKKTSLKIADKLGIDRCFEIHYPDGFKDANEYFKLHTKEQFSELVKGATPYYSYQFKGVGDIIKGLRDKEDNEVKLDLLPKVNIDKDWLVVVSGISNVGKTSFVLNLADELANQDIPTLVLPFERGIETVGRRFLQIKFEKTLQDFKFLEESEWEDIVEDCIDTPLYFALPKKNEITETIIKARRLFGTRFVIIDHLDYIVRRSNGNKESEIGDTLHELKRVAEDYGIVMIIVTHIRKINYAGSEKNRTPNIEDLKGSASLYQDPECVVMLTETEIGGINVNIVKNKGAMSSGMFLFNTETGKLTKE